MLDKENHAKLARKFGNRKLALEKEEALEAEKRKVAELKAQIAAGSVGTAGEAHASQQH